MGKISHLTGFCHFTTEGWKDDTPLNVSCQTFVWLCAYGYKTPADLPEFINNYNTWFKKIDDVTEIHTFLGMSKEEWKKVEKDHEFLKIVIKNRSPFGKISAFYVCDTLNGHIHISFSFCSPEDVKLGKFNKKEGRERAFKRFYGLDGEEMKRVVLVYGTYGDHTVELIADFIYDLNRGFYSEEQKNPDYLSDEIARFRVVEGKGKFKRDSKENTPEVWVEGETKIPSWIGKFKSIVGFPILEHQKKTTIQYHPAPDSYLWGRQKIVNRSR